VISNILIPTDFSPASWQAIMFGLGMSKTNNSRVSLLHVYPIISKYSTDKKEIELPTKLDEVKSKMDEFSKNLMERGKSEIENVVLPGNVEETILDYISKNQFDIVIVGVNGNGVNNDLGSHTASLIEKSNTPVLVVPNLKSSNGAIIAS